MTQELLALADKVEKATGPDRELDEEVAAAVVGATREVQSDGRAAYHRGSCWVSVGVVKPYSASLDAAASLVPDGMSWRMECWQGDRPEAIARVLSDGLLVVAATRSPALALTAAALRARAHQSEIDH
jgi:hypothetical protein